MSTKNQYFTLNFNKNINMCIKNTNELFILFVTVFITYTLLVIVCVKYFEKIKVDIYIFYIIQ